MRLGRSIGIAGHAALVLLLLATAPQCSVQAEPGMPGKPTVCRVGLNIEDLYDFNIARDAFGAALWVWTLCPSLEPAPLETIDFPTATSVDLGEVKTIEIDPTTYYQYRRVKGTFRYDWDTRRYPFDQHHLVVPMDEVHLGASVVVFEPDLASSFLSPAIRTSLGEWEISDLMLQASLTEEISTYGLPIDKGARYARLEIALDVKRTQLLAFFKLTFGVFAAALITHLSFFLDPRDKDSLRTILSLLVGVLFAVLLNLRAADDTIGDVTRPTLLTEIHFVALALIVACGLLAVRDRLRAERGMVMRYPNWPLLATTAGLYVLITVGLVMRATWG